MAGKGTGIRDQQVERGPVDLSRDALVRLVSRATLPVETRGLTVNEKTVPVKARMSTRAKPGFLRPKNVGLQTMLSPSWA